jgi:chemotaxis methyl-accepting protein methylase
LSDTFLPDLLKQMPLGRRLRIWSAACSTGEEPYSLAIVLKERMGKVLYSWDVGILATDLDSNVLATGERGIYTSDRFEEMEPSLRERWFQQEVAGTTREPTSPDRVTHPLADRALPGSLRRDRPERRVSG